MGDADTRPGRRLQPLSVRRDAIARRSYNLAAPGPSVADYSDAFLRGIELRSRIDARDDAGAVHDLRMQDAYKQRQDRALGQSLAPRVYGAEPQTITTPGTPAVAPSLVDSMQREPDPEAEANAFLPRTMGAPARPGETISAHTEQSIVNAVGGPEAMAALMRTPEGQQAVAMKKPITQDEFERRTRASTARTSFRAGMDEADMKRTAGDEIGALDASMRAWRAAADSMDNPASAIKQIEELRGERQRLAKDAREKELADADARLIAPLVRAYQQDPSPTTWAAMFEAFAGASSQHYSKKADVFINQIAKDADDEIRKNRLGQATGAIHKAAGDMMAAQREKGQPIDLDRALMDAMANNPAAAKEYLDVVMFGGKDVPAPLLRALFGKDEKVLATIAQEAHALVSGAPGPDGQPMQAGTPAYYQALSAKVTELTKARQRPPASRVGGTNPNDPERRDLMTLRGQITRQITALEKNTPFGAAKQQHADSLASLRRQLKDVDAKLSAKGMMSPDDDEDDDETPTTTPASPVSMLTPEQKAAYKTVFDGVMTELFPGRAPVTLDAAEKERVRLEVNRRRSALPR